MRFATCLTVLLFITSFTPAGEEKFVDLLGKDLTGWKLVPESAKDTFAVKALDDAPTLFISGKPLGYVHTQKKFRDYLLRFEWKAGKEGQSGLLLHIQEPHKVWPRCVQVQMQEESHGRLFTMGGAEGSFIRDKAAQRKAVKVGEWNQTEVSVNGGKIAVKINGVEVSSGQSELNNGYIGFQSEGTEYHFRKVQVWEK